MNFATIKSTLDCKLRSLDADVIQWRWIASDNSDLQDDQAAHDAASDELGKATRKIELAVFSKHQSQIRRLCDLFDGIIAKLRAQLNAPNTFDGQDPFDAADRMSKKILQGHALWAYFRNKFLLRRSTNLQKYLAAADEFAWACFKPLSVARRNVTGDDADMKVPPLIYLGQDLSPFVFPRDWSLKSKMKNVDDDLFLAVINKSPFSVVSLPYYQTAHLPETMVLAHEMGHVVEMDLGLGTALDNSLNAIPDDKIDSERKEVWKRCRVEAFADVFGAAMGGIAFCRSLATFLAGDRAKIVNKVFGSKPKFEYPTPYLRVKLALQVLRGDDDKLPEGAKRVEDDWIGQYGKMHLQKSFEDDLPLVVKSMLDTPFAELGGGEQQTIRKLSGLTVDDEKRADADADDMIKLGTIPEASDARVLFAAATLAYHTCPEKYKENNVEQLVLDRVENQADKTPRAANSIPDGLDKTDHARGEAIADLLGT